MKRAFCTIVTLNYLPFAKTLFQSIRQFDLGIDAFTLVVDSDSIFETEEFKSLLLSDLSESGLVKMIIKKYSNNPDSLRWSLKSVLMIHLLNSGKYDQVFFVDPDLYFYSDFRFLYNELGDSSFLLSPHWGCFNPEISELYFNRLMTDGIYNGGFIGATYLGIDGLFWWAKMNIYACEVDKSRGIYVDQAYLNLFPLLYPDYKIISHRGCNVAEWNRFENIRSLDSKCELLLNGTYPLVFIHFSNLGYLVEHDPLLIPYLKGYENILRKNGWKGDLLGQAQSYVERNRLKSLSFCQRLIRKIVGHNRFFRLKGWGKVN